MSARNKGKKKAQGADDEPEKGARGRKMTPEKAIVRVLANPTLI
jgi:hypothetical protein